MNILEEALQLTHGPRAEVYGPPEENWKATVDIFNAMTGSNLIPEEGVLFALAMKLARLRRSPDHRDSMVDLAGYAWVLAQVAGVNEVKPTKVGRGKPV